ncbi:MAG: hypothetical protein WKG07_45765 [Hymenobacter sp.]
MRVTIHLVSRADYWPLALARRLPALWLRTARHDVSAEWFSRRRRRCCGSIGDGPIRRTDLDELVGKDRSTSAVGGPAVGPAVGHLGCRRPTLCRGRGLGSGSPPADSPPSCHRASGAPLPARLARLPQPTPPAGAALRTADAGGARADGPPPVLHRRRCCALRPARR